MNTKTKKHLIIGLIIFLVAVNIAALSTIIYRNRAMPQPIVESNYEQFRQRVDEQGMYRFFKDELQLSPEQFNRFREINEDNRQQSREIARKMHIKRLEMVEQISKENPDNKKLDQIALEIGTLHYELKRNTYHHFLELKEICNQEQQEKLQHLFMRMIDDQGFDKRPRRMNRHIERKGREGRRFE